MTAPLRRSARPRRSRRPRPGPGAHHDDEAGGLGEQPEERGEVHDPAGQPPASRACPDRPPVGELGDRLVVDLQGAGIHRGGGSLGRRGAGRARDSGPHVQKVARCHRKIEKRSPRLNGRWSGPRPHRGRLPSPRWGGRRPWRDGAGRAAAASRGRAADGAGRRSGGRAARCRAQGGRASAGRRERIVLGRGRRVRPRRGPRAGASAGAATPPSPRAADRRAARGLSGPTCGSAEHPDPGDEHQRARERLQVPPEPATAWASS